MKFKSKFFQAIKVTKTARLKRNALTSPVSFFLHSSKCATKVTRKTKPLEDFNASETFTIPYKSKTQRKIINTHLQKKPLKHCMTKIITY